MVAGVAAIVAMIYLNPSVLSASEVVANAGEPPRNRMIDEVAASEDSAAPVDDPLPVCVQLKSGTVIFGVTNSATVEWTDIEATGESRSRKVSLREVERLQLAGESVAKLVDSSRQLILDLNAQDFRVRESAEQTLTQRMQGTQAANIKPLLEFAAQQSILEVQYRVERILKSASNSAPQANRLARADLLLTKSQQSFSGDAGGFVLELLRGSETLSLGRDEVRVIQVLPAGGDHRVTRTTRVDPLGGKLWNGSQLPIPPDQRSQLRLIDFETDSFGLPLVKDPNQKLDRMFTDFGLILNAAEGVGHIGVSPFFKMIFAGRPTGENSICVFDTRGSLKRRHIGITEFEFCVPGQPASPAGVHQFEIYAGEINRPRDFLLQAFNVDGQVLATVEASDELGCCFRVESVEPIALVRILTNPYLFSLKRDVDNDYALDNVSFSRPVPIPPVQPSKDQAVVRTWSGESFVATSLTIGTDSISFACEGLAGTQQIPINEIESLIWPHGRWAQPQPQSGRWFALLADRSVWEIKPGEQPQSTRFPDWKFTPEEVVAYWPAADYLRFPEEADFAAGQPILVFPTCRLIVPDLQISGQGLDWSAGSTTKQMQQVFLKELTEDEKVKQKTLMAEDPSPDFTALPWTNANVAQWPSVWLRKPPTVAAAVGSLWLTNGEIVRFGEGQQWNLGAISAEHLELRNSEQRVLRVGWGDVARLAFPEK